MLALNELKVSSQHLGAIAMKYPEAATQYTVENTFKEWRSVCYHILKKGNADHLNQLLSTNVDCSLTQQTAYILKAALKSY